MVLPKIPPEKSPGACHGQGPPLGPCASQLLSDTARPQPCCHQGRSRPSLGYVGLPVSTGKMSVSEVQTTKGSSCCSDLWTQEVLSQ